jgi:hypothetical protein
MTHTPAHTRRTKATNDMDSPTHLTERHHPHSLAVLRATFRRLTVNTGSLSLEFTSHGAFVDWDAMLGERFWLSTRDKAAVLIARALADIEHGGGYPEGIIAAAIHVGILTTDPEPDGSARD